jgi:hypothetical protein
MGTGPPIRGHSDFATTKRYVHRQEHTIMEAMERARNAQGGHKFGHTNETAIESPEAFNRRSSMIPK